jgi:carbamoyltransferase
MVIVGISAIDCESAVSVLIDGKVVWAASEERFTRVKQQSGFPHRAIRRAFLDTGITARDVSVVTFPFLGWGGESREMAKSFALSLRDEATNASPWAKRLYHVARYGRATANQILRMQPKWYRQLHRGLVEFGLESKLRLLRHHPTHAVSAYHSAGWDRALIVVMDGYGSGECSTVFVGEHGNVRQVLSVRSPHSLGNLYAAATKALGFVPNRHEGKVLGLAAYGKPEPVRSELLAGIRQWPGGYAMDSMLSCMRDSARQARRYSREDVAAGYQAVLEEVGIALVRHCIKQYGIDKVALAGGVMANVKFNQRVAEIDGVSEVFVFPAMADPGTGYGGVLSAYAESHRLEPTRLSHVYLGPEFGSSEMARALTDAGLDARAYDDCEERVAQLLSRGFCVARFNGRMEFGPRALGNRSVLSQATDPSINQSLNDRLRRTEFMPFAPITLFEHASERYVGVDAARHAAEFMTITFDCTAKMKRESPAAVHVDGTARPQLVRSDVNPSMYRILRRYHELTGIPSVINTSFNMHEEPIVCSPADAVRGFLDGNIEFLAMGSYLVAHPAVKSAGHALESIQPAVATAV